MDIKEKIEEIILECLEFDEEVNSFDGLTNEDGDSIPDPNWIYRVRDQKVKQIMEALSNSFKEGRNNVIEEIEKIIDKKKIPLTYSGHGGETGKYLVYVDDILSSLKEEQLKQE